MVSPEPTPEDREGCEIFEHAIVVGIRNVQIVFFVERERGRIAKTVQRRWNRQREAAGTSRMREIPLSEHQVGIRRARSHFCAVLKDTIVVRISQKIFPEGSTTIPAGPHRLLALGGGLPFCPSPHR